MAFSDVSCLIDPPLYGDHGAPVLDEARAGFEGRVIGRLPLGDHVGHLLEPLGAYATADAGDTGQLRSSDAADIGAGHPPEEARSR